MKIDRPRRRPICEKRSRESRTPSQRFFVERENPVALSSRKRNYSDVRSQETRNRGRRLRVHGPIDTPSLSLSLSSPFCYRPSGVVCLPLSTAAAYNG